MVAEVDVAELTDGDPVAVAEANAVAKAQAGAAAALPDDTVLGADTLVVAGEEIYGKPATEARAREMLRRLSGQTHRVITGVALAHDGRVECLHDVTEVTFRVLGQATLEHYLHTGEWRGRAGGYAIQGAGAALVRRIEGDYTNVVGLPVAAMLERWPRLEAACR